MNTLKDNIELQLRNLYIDFQQQLRAYGEWDDKLWRGPRVLVPIHVDALVVESDDADKEWARVKLEPEAIDNFPHDDSVDSPTDRKQPG